MLDVSIRVCVSATAACVRLALTRSIERAGTPSITTTAVFQTRTTVSAVLSVRRARNDWMAN